jgi:hypothetical protein
MQDPDPTATAPAPAAQAPTPLSERLRASLNPCALTARLLGLTHLSASLSFGGQALGLIGAQGISPWAGRVAEAGRVSPLWELGASDGVISALSWGWVMASALLTLGLLPAPSLALALLCAVSLSQASAPFLPFQWDLLLHEASLLGLLYVPWSLTLSRGASAPRAPWRAWGLRLLLCKLMWDSGIAKLVSGDRLWTDLRALDVHFFTQPLPHAGAALAASLPRWALSAGTYLTLAVELWAPLLLWLRVRRAWALWGVAALLMAVGVWRGAAPTLASWDTLTFALLALSLDERAGLLERLTGGRIPLGPLLPTAYAAAVPMALLMSLIALTGSYGFFQLLVLALIVAHLEPQSAPPARSALTPSRRPLAPPLATPLVTLLLTLWGAASAALHVPWLGVKVIQGAFEQERARPGGGGVIYQSYRAFEWTQQTLGPWQIVARYGLFATMTRERAELVIEGSADGAVWVPYQHPYKPNGEPTPPPAAWLHMPRLDWQMWFEALSPTCQESWLLDLLEALLEGREGARGLLVGGPEPTPRLVRVRRVRMLPTATGFWRARPAGLYCPETDLPHLRAAREELK